MCGIAGVYARPGETASPQLLLRMGGELRHRGPDGAGLYLDRRFGMVNTRLAIIDPAGGDQPLGDETGRFWVMQNGEIYNAPELRRQLEAAGHCFATQCDTEVLAHAYEEWGVDCLPRLNGAFALAVWDAERQELLLARDRLGIRPLFLAEFGGGLSFASEAKALLRHPQATRGICPVGLAETLTLWSCSPEYSCFRGVRELPPGCFLRLGPDGDIRQQRWWDLDFAAAAPDERGSASHLAFQLRELLKDATRLRLRADVPVAAYLSGGLDSSAIVALAKGAVTSQLRTFAVRFEDARYDERGFQDRAAAALDVELFPVEYATRRIAQRLTDVVRLTEKPLLRTSPAPLLALSQAVHAQGFKVVLTGEGADETLSGYNIFRENKVRRFWARQPDSTARPRLLERLYPYLGESLKRGGGFVHQFFGRGLTETDDPLYSHRIRWHNAQRLAAMLHPDLLQEAAAAGSIEERLRARLPTHFRSFSPLSKAQYLEIVTFLQGYLLHSQGDRMLMGSSVEGRFPFLDHRVLEFSARLPDRLRLHGLREKHLLRRAVEPLLPADIVRRPKQPYRAPILAAFFAPQPHEEVAELLSPRSLDQAGLFNARAVGTLVRKCQRSCTNQPVTTRGAQRRRLAAGVSETDEMGLVAVLTTMLLDRLFVQSAPQAPPVTPSRIVVGRRIARRPQPWEPAA